MPLAIGFLLGGAGIVLAGVGVSRMGENFMQGAGAVAAGYIIFKYAKR